MPASGRSVRMLSISLRSSSSSDWRAMSSKLLRNWSAIARALPIHWPTMRIRRGKSFGPTTTRATISTMRIWLQLKSSMLNVLSPSLVLRRAQDEANATASSVSLPKDEPTAHGPTVVWSLFGVGVGVGVRRTGNGLGVLRIVQALAKALDALGDVAHQVGNLAAAAEQQQRDDRQNQNVPDAQPPMKLSFSPG